MIVKFVVRKVWANSSLMVKCFDDKDDAIKLAKEIRKSIDAAVFGYETVVEESRFADKEKMRQDFAIDSHVRWASYFDELD